MPIWSLQGRVVPFPHCPRDVLKRSDKLEWAQNSKLLDWQLLWLLSKKYAGFESPLLADREGMLYKAYCSWLTVALTGLVHDGIITLLLEEVTQWTVIRHLGRFGMTRGRRSPRLNAVLASWHQTDMNHRKTTLSCFPVLCLTHKRDPRYLNQLGNFSSLLWVRGMLRRTPPWDCSG